MGASSLVPVIVGGAIGIAGSIAVACIAARRHGQEQRISRRAGFLENQLKRVYGPVNFFIRQNKLIFEHSRNLQEAGIDLFSKGPASTEAEVMKAQEKQIDDAIDVGNDFLAQAVGNNHAISEYLSENYAYVDLDDAKLFDEIAFNTIRHEIEFERSKKGKARLALELQLKLTLPTFLHPAWIDTLQTRFEQKLTELERLRAAQNRWFF
jgi:hypothetical protein